MSTDTEPRIDEHVEDGDDERTTEATATDLRDVVRGWMSRLWSDRRIGLGVAAGVAGLWGLLAALVDTAWPADLRRGDLVDRDQPRRRRRRRARDAVAVDDRGRTARVRSGVRVGTTRHRRADRRRDPRQYLRSDRLRHRTRLPRAAGAPSDGAGERMRRWSGSRDRTRRSRRRTAGRSDRSTQRRSAHHTRAARTDGGVGTARTHRSDRRRGRQPSARVDRGAHLGGGRRSRPRHDDPRVQRRQPGAAVPGRRTRRHRTRRDATTPARAGAVLHRRHLGPTRGRNRLPRTRPHRHDHAGRLRRRHPGRHRPSARTVRSGSDLPRRPVLGHDARRPRRSRTARAVPRHSSGPVRW